MLDKSKSVKIANLHKVIDSLVDLVDKFEPAPDKDHFGLVTFNRRAHVEFTFAEEARFTKEQLKEKIKDMPRTLELQTRTDLAMQAARDQLFSPSGGDRPDKPNVMIVLTDGKPTKQPKDFKIFATEFYQDPKVQLVRPLIGLDNLCHPLGNQMQDQNQQQPKFGRLRFPTHQEVCTKSVEW